MWKKISPIYVVDRIEPCLEFWVEKLGFTVEVQVPEGDHLGFAVLRHDQVEIMYRSRDSLRRDFPDISAHPLEDSSVAYIELESLDEILPKLEGLEIALPLQRTFHGSKEIGIRGPGGRLVIFSAPSTAHTETTEDP